MSTSSTPITGHCLCGDISYTIDEHLNKAVICHCEDCRRSTGAVSNLLIIVPKRALTVKGDYKEHTVTGLSGQPVHRAFCPNCGGHIAIFSDSHSDVAFITAGTLADHIQKTLTPNFEVFTRDRLPYIQDRFGMQFETKAS